MRRWLALLVLLIGCSRQQASDSLSDRELRRILTDAWNATTLHFRLGELEVVRGDTTSHRQKISLDEFRLYQAFDDSGILEISTKQDLTSEFTGWDDWFRLWGEGMQKELLVAPTKEGLRLGSSSERVHDQGLSIPTGTYEIEEVLRNEAVEKPPEHYRVVAGTHRVTMDPLVATALGKYYRTPIDEERKFRALLKYDPFKNGWSLVCQDWQDRTKEFETDCAVEYLKAH